MTTLFNLKEQLGMVGEELISAETELNKLASNPSAKMEDIEAAKTRRDGISARLEIIKAQHDDAERRQKDSAKIEVVENKEQTLARAKSEFYRAKLLRQPVPTDVLATLTAIDSSSTTGGENLIPTTMVGPIITEPTLVNPLRGIWSSSSVRGLELPKLDVTIDESDFYAFIDDDESGVDAAGVGSNIAFGRYKTKLIATVSDTVLHAADNSLAGVIEQNLRDALAYKEIMCAFGDPDVVAQPHMSFYEVDDSSAPLVAEVSADGMRNAIIKSLYTLHPRFRANARVAMSGLGYAAMLDDLVNENATYFSATPEQILGARMVEVPIAGVPVVGDFSQVHINYDPNFVYDTDKNVRTGNYQFVVTVWFDIQRKLNSAFKQAVDTSS